MVFGVLGVFLIHRVHGHRFCQIPRLGTPGFMPIRAQSRLTGVPQVHVAVAQPVRVQGTGIHAPRHAVRKEGAAKRLRRARRQTNGTRRFHRDHGVVGVHAIVVPAVNGHRERLRQLDALQLQVVNDQAGRQSGQRIDPRFNY